MKLGGDGESLGGVKGKQDQNTVYACIKFSKNDILKQKKTL